MTASRALLPFLALLPLYGCGVSDWVHDSTRDGKIIPALRYAMNWEDKYVYEDISEGHAELAFEMKRINVAEGPMEVDCQQVREIGIIIVPDNSWGHDFDFVANWQDTAHTGSKHFTFEKHRVRYLKGATRFRGPLSDGLISMSVTHRREKIYTTEFEIVGC